MYKRTLHQHQKSLSCFHNPMLRQCLYIGLASLFVFGGSQFARASTATAAAAADSTLIGASITPGTTVSSSTNPAPPAPMSLSTSETTPLPTPSTGGTASGAHDSSQNRKFYTISCGLREIYDNNIFTAAAGRIASVETQVSPSVLFDFPMQNSDLSIRETFTATYYSNRPGDVMDYTNEFIAQFQHSFSDRFSLNLAEQFRYYTEPSLFENIGTPYYSGAYIANTFNGSFNAQWTPLVSTLLTYSNTVVDYFTQAVATGQNSLENTASGTLGFAILPKITLTFGGIVDDITYDQIDRGYTTLTGNTGVNWSALPSLNVSGAV